MQKNSVRKKYAVYIMLIGLAIVALEWKIDTGVSYGFVMGENEGVSMYVITQFVTSYVGGHLSIDIFFNPLGYVLIAAGFICLGKSSISTRGIIMSVIGIIANLVEMFIPMMLDVEDLCVPVIVLHLLQVVAVISVMYALTGICTKKIDNYKYMQVGKDLRFGAELYGICLIIGKILYLFTRADWYFSHILYVVVTIASLCAVLYYIVKMCIYLGQVEMFADREEIEENERK